MAYNCTVAGLVLATGSCNLRCFSVLGLVLVVLYVRRKWLKFFEQLRCFGLRNNAV